MALLRLALLALGAGPLAAGQTSTQAPSTIGAVPLDVELTEAGLREDETITEATSIASDETSATTTSPNNYPTTTGELPNYPTTTGEAPSPTAFPGMIQWAPYKRKGSKRKGSKRKGSKKGNQRGGYGGYRGRADVPEPKLQPAGRQWVSKDKVKAPAQILNVKPSFLYPEVRLTGVLGHIVFRWRSGATRLKGRIKIGRIRIGPRERQTVVQPTLWWPCAEEHSGAASPSDWPRLYSLSLQGPLWGDPVPRLSPLLSQQQEVHV
jgi:hypothetical protein